MVLTRKFEEGTCEKLDKAEMNCIKLLVLAAMPVLLFSQGGGSVPSSDDLTKGRFHCEIVGAG